MSSIAPALDGAGPDEVGPSKGRHPAGLYVLFATEMWERFSFYTMLAMLTLYLQDTQQGFGWEKKTATGVYANYLMFVYASPLIGGWLADRKLGLRVSIVLGGLFMMAGHILLAFPSVVLLYSALVCLVIGNGFFKPNVSAMVGTLYPATSPLKDSAYNIFYMGINVGACLAPVVAEFVKQKYGFHPAFAVAGGGMALSIVIFLALQRHIVEISPTTASPLGTKADASVAALTEDVPPTRKPSDLEMVPERNRIAALLVIFGIVIVFWMVFHQNGSTMTYWADENTNWKVSGIISNSINPFWVVFLSLPLVRFWGFLRTRGLEPSTPTKMAIGMLMTSLAFLILYVGAKSGGDQTFLTAEQAKAKQARLTVEAEKEDAEIAKLAAEAEKYPEKHIVVPKKAIVVPKEVIPEAGGRLARTEKGEYWADQNKVSPAWLILAYMVISLGELMLSPMGLSLVSKVAPARMRSLMMGGWFVATAIGNKLTAIGVLWTEWYHSSFWLLCCSAALVMAFVLMVLLRPLKKAMPGV